MKKKHQNAKLLVLALIMLLTQYLFINWRALWATREIKQDNICVVDSQCVSVDAGRTQEIDGVAFDRRIYCFTLEDGQVVSAYKDVQCRNPITQCDVPDLAPAKRFLYPALFPGHQALEKAYLEDPKIGVLWAKPRMLWERMPLFDEEVTETETSVELAWRPDSCNQ